MPETNVPEDASADVEIEPDSHLQDDEAPRESSSVARPIGVTTIGAWTGTSSLQDETKMRRDVDFCVEHGIRHLSIMVNDHSRARAPRGFDTYDRARIVQLSRMAIDAGMDVHLTSWIMPHETYIRSAAAQLVPLVRESGARALELDAEEPWTQAQRPMEYDAAAGLIRQLLGATRFGVTGIGYTPADKFGPLAEMSDFVVPQIYCTSTSRVDPDTDIELLAKRYRDLFGHKATIVGLAAYGQSGIEGHTIESALRTAFKHTTSLAYVRQVTYWSLSWIRSSRIVAATIKSLSGAGRQHPTISGSVGRGGTNRRDDVVVVQRLLLERGTDPGLADGIVGARTIAAIEAFQRRLGYANPDGRVDPNGPTFTSLAGA